MLNSRKILLLLAALLGSMMVIAQTQKPKAKPVLYIFSAQWCAPCQRMHNEALEDRDVVALLQHMEYHPVDMEFTQKAEELYRKHARSGGVPELVMYDGSGKLIARQAGYTTTNELETFLRKAFTDEELKQIEVEQQRFKGRYNRE